MFLADRALAAFAAQLGRPAGIAGRVVGRLLNRGNRPAILAAVDAAGVSTDSAVADIGFGGGAGLDALLHRVGENGAVHGVEVSPTMLDEARARFSGDLERGRLRLHDASIEDLPFPDETVDAIISTNTIYFIEDLPAALRELERVLRPGGRLVLGIGDPHQMSKMPFTKHGFRLRQVDEVIAAIRGAGFTSIEDRRVGQGPVAFHLLVCTRPADPRAG